MSNQTLTASVVTLTYGSRWKYLSQVLERLLADPRIDQVLVIDNAAEEPIGELVAQRAWNERVVVMRMPENLGSAAGYKVGIEAALNRFGSPFLYLLDDDNLPAPGALDQLFQLHEARRVTPQDALLSLRPDRVEFVRAINGLMNIRIRQNSFLGFHVGDIGDKALRHLRLKMGAGQATPKVRHTMCKVGYAPYGGLLLSRELLQTIGLPDERFFLYADDYEYSARIARHGGHIWLCADSVVEDIEKSWNLGKVAGHPLLDVNASDFRIYYSTRNRVYLEYSHYASNRLVYLLNQWVYLTAIFIWSVLRAGQPGKRLARLKFLHQCIREGMNGQLGRNRLVVR